MWAGKVAMCNGPSDTEANIKACLDKTADTEFLEDMLIDWKQYKDVGNGPKMIRCIKAVIRKRKHDG